MELLTFEMSTFFHILLLGSLLLITIIFVELSFVLVTAGVTLRVGRFLDLFYFCDELFPHQVNLQLLKVLFEY